MATCSKCKQPVYIPDKKDFVVCSCGEVVMVNNNNN